MMVYGALNFLTGLYAPQVAVVNNQAIESSKEIEGPLPACSSDKPLHVDRAIAAVEETNDYWSCISAEDRAYLLGPREYPSPCLWCGGRLRHNPQCVTWTWEPEMPFGKHKGKKVSDVPLDYLRWLAKNSVRLDEELRSAIERRLENVLPDKTLRVE